MSDFDEQPHRWRSRGTLEDMPRDDDTDSDQIPTINVDWSEQEPYNPGWRRHTRTHSTRSPRRRSRAPNLVPTSVQEIPLWLQQGGWRFIAAAAVLFVFLLSLLLWNNRSAQSISSNGELLVGNGADVAGNTDGATNTDPLAVPPTAPPTAPPMPDVFVVSGTAGQGLFLRSEPDSNAVVLETLPDGTNVEQIGDENPGPNYVWRHVRAPSGQEGWVAAEWLQPAP